MRQSGHDKWLIERRSEEFIKFISMLSTARMDVTDIIYDRNFNEQISKDIKITETYLPVMNQAKVVRLFLPHKYRDVFYKLAKKFVDTHSSYDLGQERLPGLEIIFFEIQKIFESQIDPKFWTLDCYR